MKKKTYTNGLGTFWDEDGNIIQSPDDNQETKPVIVGTVSEQPIQRDKTPDSQLGTSTADGEVRPCDSRNHKGLPADRTQNLKQWAVNEYKEIRSISTHEVALSRTVELLIEKLEKEKSQLRFLLNNAETQIENSQQKPVDELSSELVENSVCSSRITADNILKIKQALIRTGGKQRVYRITADTILKIKQALTLIADWYQCESPKKKQELYKLINGIKWE